MAAPERSFAGRNVSADAISVPDGFVVEAVATGLNIPSGVEFDENNNIFITEMGSLAASAYVPGRIIRIRDDGSSLVVRDDFQGALTGIAYVRGSFFVSEHAVPSRVWQIFDDGSKFPFLTDLPGGGDHPICAPLYASSEFIYIGVGTMTNSGVAGMDNEDWLQKHPHLHDIPARDVTLAGRNFESTDLLYGRESARTGPFKQFGADCSEGEVVRGETPATGAIVRADSHDAGGFEVVAWGLREITGMAVHQDGRIYCADIGMAEWGSRPVADNHERVWQVLEAGWYGWPDFAGGVPVTDARFKPRYDPQPEFLLRDHPMDNLVRDPVATFPPGAGLSKMDFTRSRMFADENTAFLALGGDILGISDHGFRVMTLDVNTGAVDDFAVNKRPGPSSVTGSGGFEHPVDVRFDRTGEAMYVVDLGVIEMTPGGPSVLPGTGVLWRISWVA